VAPPLPAWCEGPPGSHYAHIQEAYWKLGLLSYWEPKQLPNFALAAPMVVFAARTVWAYHAADPGRLLGLLGLRAPSGRAQRGAGAEPPGAPRRLFETSSEPMPQVVLLGALLVYGLLLMHVQVITRLLAVFPVLYWHAAELWLAPDQDEEEEETEKKTQKTARGSPGGAVEELLRRRLLGADTVRLGWLRPGPRRWLLGWGAGYTVIGAALFSNFYPWT
jgi:phosphatidylinositol glycan class V